MKVREQERVPTNYASAARMPACRVDVVIIDVSESGCRIMTENRSARVGATIILALPHDEFASGQIVWKDKAQCGVHFSKAISVDMIDSIAAQIGPLN